MKFTSGEARGAVLLAATLAFLLAVVAWHNGRGVGDVQPPALPSEVRRAADSEAISVDSCRMDSPVTGRNEVGENTRPASAWKRKRRGGGKGAACGGGVRCVRRIRDAGGRADDRCAGRGEFQGAAARQLHGKGDESLQRLFN